MTWLLIPIHPRDALHGLVHDLLALVFANVVQQLLVFFGSWQTSCDQRVQVAEALGVFVLGNPVGFTEEIFAFLGGAEIVKGARQHLLAKAEGSPTTSSGRSPAFNYRPDLVPRNDPQLARLLHDGGTKTRSGSAAAAEERHVSPQQKKRGELQKRTGSGLEGRALEGRAQVWQHLGFTEIGSVVHHVFPSVSLIQPIQNGCFGDPKKVDRPMAG